jgi:Ras-related protein Rab-23
VLARNLGVRLFRTSVKEDLNVAAVFRYLATRCHEIIKQQYNTVLPITTPTISQFSPTFHSKTNGTIILTRPLRKSSKKKNMLKKCGII